MRPSVQFRPLKNPLPQMPTATSTATASKTQQLRGLAPLQRAKNHPVNRLTALLLMTLATCLCSTGCSPSAEQLETTRAELRKTIGLPEGPILKPISVTSKSPIQPTPNPADAFATPDLSPTTKEPSVPSAPNNKTTPSEALSSWVDLNSLPRMQWEILYVGNRPVGYTRRTIELANNEFANNEFANSEQPLLRIEAESRVRIKTKAASSSDQSVIISSLESPQGQLARFDGKLDLGPNKRRFQARVVDSTLTIDQITSDPNGKQIVDSTSVPWAASELGPFALEESLQRTPMQPKEIRTVRYLDPFRMAISESRLEAIEIIETVDLSGKLTPLLEIQNRTLSQGRESNSTLWVDPQGIVRKSYNPTQDVLAFACDPLTARFVISKDEFDAITFKPIPLLGSLPKRPSDPSLLFRVSSASLPLTSLLSNRTNQVVRENSPNTATNAVDVEVFSSSAIPFESFTEDPPTPDSISPSETIRWNEPSFQKWLAIQREKQTLPTNPTDRAEVAWNWIREAISQSTLDKSIQSPSETVRMKKGDSIDQSLCLVAILRSLDIHARIASGLRAEPSSVRPTLAFHTWAEYHNGQAWLPVDPSNESFITPPDRIKVTESNFTSLNIYEPLLQAIRILPELEVTVKMTR